MIVVDCSFVVDLLVRPSSLQRVPREGTEWFAPALLDVEIVSVIRGLLLGRRLGREEAQAALEDYARLGITMVSSSVELRRRMLALAHHVSAYDASYLALAEGLDAELWTRDRSLVAAAWSTVSCVLV